MNKDGTLRPGVNFWRPVLAVLPGFIICPEKRVLSSASPQQQPRFASVSGFSNELDLMTLLPPSPGEHRHLCLGLVFRPSGPWQTKAAQESIQQGQVGKD